MSLVNIKYGSLASSETMNKNFMYLDNKISDTSESIMTSISSILSNIATINTRLNDISENVDNSIESLMSKIEDYKTKVKILVNRASMVPDWANSSILDGLRHTISSNGYLLILPAINAAAEISINGKTFYFKSWISNFDNGNQLAVIPVNKGDIITYSTTVNNIYFVPSMEINIENF